MNESGMAEAYLSEVGLLEKLHAMIAAEEEAIAPDLWDLARLHWLITDRRFYSVLEFGSGYSTLVMAHAIAGLDYELLPQRNDSVGRLTTVDTSRRWLDLTLSRLSDELRSVVVGHVSSAQIVDHPRYGLCSLHRELPDVTPDFVYLDGPAPSEVEGSVRGLTFAPATRTPLAADLLVMETLLIPGTTVLVDGRTANVRFLMRNFTREWDSTTDSQFDFSLLQLVEPRYGTVDVLACDVYGRRPLGEGLIEVGLASDGPGDL